MPLFCIAGFVDLKKLRRKNIKVQTTSFLFNNFRWLLKYQTPRPLIYMTPTSKSTKSQYFIDKLHDAEVIAFWVKDQN